MKDKTEVVLLIMLTSMIIGAGISSLYENAKYFWPGFMIITILAFTILGSIALIISYIFEWMDKRK